MITRKLLRVAGICAAIPLLAACTSPDASPLPIASPAASPIETSLPTSSSPSAEMVGAYEIQTPTDLGPSEYANGVVILDGSGTPVAYEVASGDIFDFVADRLGIDGNYIATINQVRRGYTSVLFAGDTLNLDPHTITSVGTFNGRVLDEPTPEPMPPQK
ncbi:MAG: hypothetical protein QM598_06465 [Protaetiibacter sp.]